MENFEEQLNNQELSPEEKFDNFQNEIAGIKAEEMTKKEAWEARGRKGETYNPHFDLIEPEFLSEAEMKIYEKYKKGELELEEFMDLRGEALSKFKGKDDEIDPEYKSVHAFWMYVSNIGNEQIVRRQMEKLKKKK
ncbi:MAG: hypothetical protein WC461_00265 [Candidatus Paceibacterota bacterium]